MKAHGSYKMASLILSGALQYQVFMNRLADSESSTSPNSQGNETRSIGSKNSGKLAIGNTEMSDSMSSDMEEMEDQSYQDTEETDSLLMRLLDEQEQDAHSKVINWLKNCRPSSLILKPVEPPDETNKGQTPVMKLKGYASDEQERQSLLRVLKYLQLQLNPYDHNPLIGLMVPTDYPITVTIFPYLIFSTYLISSYLGASLIFLPKISTLYDFLLRVRLARFARLTHV